MPDTPLEIVREGVGHDQSIGLLVLEFDNILGSRPFGTADNFKLDPFAFFQ